MALQVVEEDVGGDVVAVPAVLGAAALVAAVLFLLAQQAVVLEVVDDLQQREADHRLRHQEGQDDGAEDDREAGEEADRHRPGGEDVVAEAEVPLAEAIEPDSLELPGGTQAADDGARQEGPKPLPQAGAGRVLGGGDFDVVPAVVLDEEVAVARLGEGDTAEPAL